jgi:beta-glucanase (GH16 family)
MKWIVAIAFFVNALQGQVMVKVFRDSLQAFEHVGGDEFSGEALNEGIWINGLGWTRVLMDQDLAFSPENVRVKSGMVRFVADKKDSVYMLQPHEIDSNAIRNRSFELALPVFRTRYSAGCIISKEKHHYGTYQIRFRVQPGKGIWPAFWFYGGHKNEELDVFELKGEKHNALHVDIHCPGDCERSYRNKLGVKTNWGGWLRSRRSIYGQWHEASLEWTPRDLTWILDGVVVAYYKGNFSNPMSLYLNTSVARDGAPFSPGPDETTAWPNYYDVDYLRIYRQVADSVVVLYDRAFAKADTSASHLADPIRKKRPYMYRKGTAASATGLITIERRGDDIEAVIQGRVAPSCVSLQAGTQTFRASGNKIRGRIGKGQVFHLTVTVGKKVLRRTMLPG